MSKTEKLTQFFEQLRGKGNPTAEDIRNAAAATGNIAEILPEILSYAAGMGIDATAELADLTQAQEKTKAENAGLVAIAAPVNRPRFERIGNAVIEPITWVVKGILESGALCMIFGDSGTCKSFITVALSACIATGQDFYSHPVKKGAVYYIAVEGGVGIVRRFRAWSQENRSITDAPLYRFAGAVNLLDGTRVLINALEEAINGESEPPVMAVIDTWSRSLAGDDSSTESAAVGLHELDIIRAKFSGLAIVIVHHTGHQAKDRARGASLIHAAVDSEFRVEKKDGTIIFTNTKSKESELLPPMVFKPKKVKLLMDDGAVLKNDDGEAETSVILDTATSEQNNPGSEWDQV